ncbi:hypothetical protein [Streptomyces zingiberis]|uniref:hypothetical protein n=1 Tax=Streptomyces zingiberis TaxID=2053010 RepID=UPI0019D2E61A|nr:hypothetical protein [Streptomyces zingiberis]
MAGPPRLQQEDRADFEAVLRTALCAAEFRGALSADPSGRAAERLRARALRSADAITAESGGTYAAYLAVREAARHPRRHTAAEGSWLAALTVLTPLIAAMAATVLLLLGYGLGLTGPQDPLPGTLVTAGWTLALVAAAATLLALGALVVTAVRHRGGTPSADDVAQARLIWQRDLLDRAMLPYLRRHLGADELSPVPPGPASRATPPAGLDGADGAAYGAGRAPAQG